MKKRAARRSDQYIHVIAHPITGYRDYIYQEHRLCVKYGRHNSDISTEISTF